MSTGNHERQPPQVARQKKLPTTTRVVYQTCYSIQDLRAFAVDMAGTNARATRLVVTQAGEVYLEAPSGQRRDLKPSLPCGQADARPDVTT